MINEVLLRRKSKINIDDKAEQGKTSDSKKAMVIAFAKNIEALGFGFSKEVYECLSVYTASELEAVYQALVPKLKALTGADKEYEPMYPNFPRQVMRASDAELYFNAIIHYYSFGELLPSYAKDERFPLVGEGKLKILSLGTTADIMEILRNLLSSKSSISEQDKQDIESIISEYADYGNYLPEEIPLKENAALLGKIISEKAAVKSAEPIAKYFKTATDVLRLVTALSNGDLSLGAPTKYRKLKRAERRMIMDLLAGVSGGIAEDMFRYQNEWIRIGEIVHPFEYKQVKYAQVNEAFKRIRENDRPLMFGGRLEKCISERDLRGAAKLLKARPGEFARRMDKLLRDAADEEERGYIIECFAAVADKVSAPVLLQLRQHFWNRQHTYNETRVFFPKGRLARAKAIPNELDYIDPKSCEAVTELCERALKGIYSAKEPMGKVYVSESLRNYVVPFSQRSASNASKVLTRGSRIPLDGKAETVRAFIWWTNICPRNRKLEIRVDIDLSAAVFNDKWEYLEGVSYLRLRSSRLQIYHSGDITNGGAPNGAGAAEFVDINIGAAAANGARYIVFQVYSFTPQYFSAMSNCRFGWMERENGARGEIFEPSTVEQRIDLTANSTVAIPVIFDCVEKKFIWCDMSLGAYLEDVRCNNLENNLSGVSAVCYAMVNFNKPNLYDLARINAQARGELVTDMGEADVVFIGDNDAVPTGAAEDENGEEKEQEIITPYDVDYIVGRLL